MQSQGSTGFPLEICISPEGKYKENISERCRVLIIDKDKQHRCMSHLIKLLASWHPSPRGFKVFTSTFISYWVLKEKGKGNN